MKLKLSEYDKLRPEIIKIMKRDGRKSISEISAAYMIPLVVIYHMYGNEFGFDKLIDAAIKRLTEFYEYDVEE